MSRATPGTTAGSDVAGYGIVRGGRCGFGLRGLASGLRNAASHANCAQGRIACGESIASPGNDQ
jgi:hypothetical protein